MKTCVEDTADETGSMADDDVATFGKTGSLDGGLLSRIRGYKNERNTKEASPRNGSYEETGECNDEGEIFNAGYSQELVKKLILEIAEIQQKQMIVHPWSGRKRGWQYFLRILVPVCPPG